MPVKLSSGQPRPQPIKATLLAVVTSTATLSSAIHQAASARARAPGCLSIVSAASNAAEQQNLRLTEAR